MNAPLKKTIQEKFKIDPSEKFDQVFFEKLNKEKKPSFLEIYWKKIAFSCAFAALGFIVYEQNISHFNQNQYVDSILEIQAAYDQNLSSDMQNDLIELSYLSTDDV